MIFSNNKEILITILITFIGQITFSQVKAIVINSATKEKVPYVNIWVQNENIGTTADEKGAFELKVEGSKTIVFSAIGFETRKIAADSIKKVLELKPIVKELEEVVIHSSKLTEELTIGEFRKSKIHVYFASGEQPWIVARHFEYKAAYKNTRYLKKIILVTKSAVKDAKFNIRLYGVNSKGEPDGYIYDKNIMGIAKKGKKVTEIDLSNLNIKFPKNGFFIAFEWLIIENNKYEYDYKMQNSNVKLHGISYEPSVGTIPAETNENSWIFRNGKWKKVWENTGEVGKGYQSKYCLIAIELTLTN